MLLLFALPGMISSQDYLLKVHVIEGEKIKGLSDKSQEILDSMGTFLVLKELMQDLRGDGYLAASVDSVVFDSLDVSAYVFAGPRFEWGILSLDSIDQKILRKAGIRARSFSGKPVKFKKLASAQKKILQVHENSGYPFASIYISRIQMEGPVISGNLHVEDNGLFLIDTFHIKGEAWIDPVSTAVSFSR